MSKNGHMSRVGGTFTGTRGTGWGVPGWVYGWGIRVGIPGGVPSSKVLTPSGGLTAKRAPEAPEGLEWVVRLQRPQDRPPVCAAAPPHPPGPVGPCRALPGWVLRLARLLANKGEIRPHFSYIQLKPRSVTKI